MPIFTTTNGSTYNGPLNYFSNLSRKFTDSLSSISLVTPRQIFSSFHSSFLSSSNYKIPNITDITENVNKKSVQEANIPNSLAQKKKHRTLAFKCLAVFAGLGLAFYKVRNRMYANDSSVFSPHDEGFGSSTFPSRHLLALPTWEFENLALSEETPFSATWIASDIFGTANGGSLTISATQTNGNPLPSGLSLTASPTTVLNQMNIAEIGSIAKVNAYVLAVSFASQNIHIISVENVLNPLTASTIPANDIVYDLACNVNATVSICYALLENNGLRVYDVSQLPTVNTLKTDATIKGSLIAISDGVGLILNGNSLYVMDLSDPFNPKIASVLNSNSFGNGIGYFDLNNGAACVTNFLREVFSLNLSNISNAIIEGSGNVQNVMHESSPFVGNIIAQGNYCILNAIDNGIQIFNRSGNGNLTLTNFTLAGNSFEVLASYGQYLYASGNQFYEIDWSNPQKLVTVSTSNPPFSPGYHQIILTDQYGFFADSSSNTLTFTTRSQTFTIQGTPTGGTAGNYTIRLKASGINQEIDFQMNISPAVMINGALTFPIVVAKTQTSIPIPQNIFSQINGGFITYTATLADGTDLSNPNSNFYVRFSPTTLTFTINAPTTAVGELMIILKGKDNFGAVSQIEVPLQIINGPTVNYQIPSLIVQQGLVDVYKLPSDLIVDNDGEDFDISVTNNGQPGVPFPNCISYNATTQTFTVSPKTSSDLGTTTVSIQATAKPSGASITTSFQIQTALPGTPVLKAPISNVVAAPNAPVALNIQGMFTSPLGENLQYTVSGYPGWMSYDPDTGILSGTPTRFDVGTDTNDVETVVVIANGEIASNTYSFTVTVQGTPTLLFANQIANAVLAIFAVISGIYAFRVRLWNNCCKARYIKEDKIVHVGDILKQHIKAISANNVKRPFALIKRKPLELFTVCGHTVHLPKKFTPKREALPGGLYLPKWLHYHHLGNLLISEPIPKEEAGLTYKIFVIDTTGYIRERFNLIIKTTLNNLIAAEGGDAEENDIPPVIKEYFARNIKKYLGKNNSLESQPLLKPSDENEQKEQRLTPPSSSNSDDKFAGTTDRRQVRSSSPIRSEAETELASIRLE